MRIASSHFKGEHDFRNFCKLDVAKVRNFRRIIFDINILLLDPRVFGDETSETSLFAIVVEGTAFLWHQVLHWFLLLQIFQNYSDRFVVWLQYCLWLGMVMKSLQLCQIFSMWRGIL